MPSLITDDREMAQKICDHPGLNWKATNVQFFKAQQQTVYLTIPKTLVFGPSLHSGNASEKQRLLTFLHRRVFEKPYRTLCCANATDLRARCQGADPERQVSLWGGLYTLWKTRDYLMSIAARSPAIMTPVIMMPRFLARVSAVTILVISGQGF